MLSERTTFPTPSLVLGRDVLSLSPPRIMGILNLTPDSFYDGGHLKTEKQVLSAAEKHLKEGASILDVGGHSSRPGATLLDEAEEIKRIAQPIAAIKRRFPAAILSVDTFRVAVAKAAWKEGISIVNDISGGHLDPEMLPWIVAHKIPYIVTHMQGDFHTMHQQTGYKDVVQEVFFALQKKISWLRAKGMSNLMADVGFGFSKTVAQNYALLDNLSFFGALQVPLLVGISRKSMVYKPLGIRPKEALAATSALHMRALHAGAAILRVHDVQAAMQLVRLQQQFFSKKNNDAP